MVSTSNHHPHNPLTSIQTLHPLPVSSADNALPPASDPSSSQQQFSNSQSTPSLSGYANTTMSPPLISAGTLAPLSSGVLNNQQQFTIPHHAPPPSDYFNPTTTVPTQSPPLHDSTAQSTAPNTFTLDFLGQLVHHMVNIALQNSQPLAAP